MRCIVCIFREKVEREEGGEGTTSDIVNIDGIV